MAAASTGAGAQRVKPAWDPDKSFLRAVAAGWRTPTLPKDEVRARLADRARQRARKAGLVVYKRETGWAITPAGRAFLATLLTNDTVDPRAVETEGRNHG